VLLYTHIRQRTASYRQHCLELFVSQMLRQLIFIWTIRQDRAMLLQGTIVMV